MIHGAGGAIGGAGGTRLRPRGSPGLPRGPHEIVAGIQEATLLHRTATPAGVGGVAAFVASDHARTMTAAAVNISCGAIIDY